MRQSRLVPINLAPIFFFSSISYSPASPVPWPSHIACLFSSCAHQCALSRAAWSYAQPPPPWMQNLIQFLFRPNCGLQLAIKMGRRLVLHCTQFCRSGQGRRAWTEFYVDKLDLVQIVHERPLSWDANESLTIRFDLSQGPENPSWWLRGKADPLLWRYYLLSLEKAQGRHRSAIKVSNTCHRIIPQRVRLLKYVY